MQIQPCFGDAIEPVGGGLAPVEPVGGGLAPVCRPRVACRPCPQSVRLDYY